MCKYAVYLCMQLIKHLETMKTQIRTSKGATVEIKYEDKQFITQIVNGPKFNTEYLSINNGKVFVGRLKNQPAELIVDAENSKKIQKLIDEVKDQKRTQKTQKYQFLIDQLPEIKIKNGDNDTKAQELLTRAKNIKFYSGEESEGLNLSVRRQKNELSKQAQTYCNHELSEEIQLTLTADIRKKAKKIVTCTKCSLSKSVSKEEKVENPNF